MSADPYDPRPYEFTLDMTCGFPETAREVFAPVLARQPIRYLEIGVYEGRSGLFMLDELLTHPDSTYTGIDLVTGHEAAYRRAIQNFARHPIRRYNLVIGGSKEVLPRMASVGLTYHLAYIDGCHSEEGCLYDLLGVWKLLIPDGVVLVDDYDRPDYGIKAAVERFLASLTPGEVVEVCRGYRIGFRKEAQR